MTIKNLSFEATTSETDIIEKVVTCEWLVSLLRTEAFLRSQVLILLKQKFRRLELMSASLRQEQEGFDYLGKELPFLNTERKIKDFLALLASIFNET